MSFLLSHLLTGALLGASAGLRLRYLPIAASMAALPDLDHLPLPGMEARVTLHSVTAVGLLSALGLAAAWRWARHRPDLLRLALAAPGILATHLLLDLLPQVTEETSSYKVALFHPFEAGRYIFLPLGGTGTDPTALSTFTLLAGGLLLLALLARASAARAGAGPAPASALALSFLLLFPALAVVGLIVPDEGAPQGPFTLSSQVLLPAGTLQVTVTAEGGDAWPRSLRLLVTGPVERSLTNADWVTPRDPWVASLDLSIPVAAALAVEVRLEANHAERRYATVAPAVQLGHLDHAIALGDLVAPPSDPGNLTLPVTVTGDAAPAGSLRVRVVDAEGREVLNRTNEERLPPGRTWRPAFPAAGPGPWTAEVRALDGFLHARRAGLQAP